MSRFRRISAIASLCRFVLVLLAAATGVVLLNALMIACAANFVSGATDLRCEFAKFVLR